MIKIRRWHAYIGLFTAPSVLFFTITGALQLFGLHEAHGRYQPPELVEKLSSVHKDQVFAPGHHPDSPGSEAPAAAGDTARASPPQPEHEDAESPGTGLLKWFFLLVALGLTLSTVFGVWMGLAQPNRKKTGWMLLAAGALIPTALLFF